MKDNFFTLDEIENYKSGILFLNSEYFYLVPMSIPKDIDERERSFEIDEKLSEHFNEYDNFYFLEKELILNSDETDEKIVLILIEKDKIYSILNRVDSLKINLQGIYPLFLVELFNLDNQDKDYIEIFDDKFRVYSFLKGKIANFEEIELEKKEIIETPEYLTEHIQNSPFIFQNQKELLKYIPNLELRDWKNYPLHKNTEFDFLPNDYKYKITFKKISKIIKITLAILIIFLSLIFFVLDNLIQNQQEELNILQTKRGKLHSVTLEKKKEIEELEKDILKFKENMKSQEFSNLKLSDLLTSLLNNPFKVIIASIEVDENKVITIVGKSINESYFYQFENYLLSLKYFDNLNHDIVKREAQGGFEFILDLEVNNGVD